MPKPMLDAKYGIVVHDNLVCVDMATKPIPKIQDQLQQLLPIYLEYYAKWRTPTVGVSRIIISI